MIVYTYEQTQTEDDPGGILWTVGATDTTGRWIADSDWETEDEARTQADKLNDLAHRALDALDHIADIDSDD